MILTNHRLVNHAILVGGDSDDARLFHVSELNALGRLDFLKVVVDQFARLDATHHGHIDVHQDETEVSFATGLSDILQVHFSALLTICAGCYV